MEEERREYKKEFRVKRGEGGKITAHAGVGIGDGRLIWISEPESGFQFFSPENKVF